MYAIFYKASYSPDVEGKTLKSVKALTAEQAVALARKRDSWGKCYSLSSHRYEVDEATGEIKTVTIQSRIPVPELVKP